MTDVFLMATVGNYKDPNRSKWRESIVVLCKQLGLEYYDPTNITRNWDETIGTNEVVLMQDCKVIIMAITADTAGIASLAESGWAALSAVKRGQTFCLYIDPSYLDKKMGPMQRLGSKIDTLLGHEYDSQEAASRRARMLALGHATSLAKQFSDVDCYVAIDMEHLISWAGNKLRQLKKT